RARLVRRGDQEDLRDVRNRLRFDAQAHAPRPAPRRACLEAAMSAPPAKQWRPELALERILAALEAGLIAATDDEIMQAGKALGMNPAMKGSAAFADVRILLASRQVRADDWAPPAPEKKNGTPSARIF